MMRKKSHKKLFIIFITLIFTGIILYAGSVLWNSGAFLPQWIDWKNGTFPDSSGNYQLTLNRRSVNITYKDTPIWTSPKHCQIQEALFCDIDNDQTDELILLCWKIGRYDRYRPFWVEEDEKTWSQHIFVYELEQTKIRPKWMSSYLGQDVSSISANIRQSSCCRLLLTGLDDRISCWVWDSWGFTKEDTDVSFVVFGDNLIHEPIYIYGLRHDPSFGFLFENFKTVISESDISIIHQETPLTDDPSKYSGYPRFGTPVNVGQAIADAGFDAVVCATNHSLDLGADGVNFTKDFFDSHRMACPGIQSESENEYSPYEIIVKNGVRFALLNYTYDTNGIRIPEEHPYMVHLLDDEKRVKEDIEKAKSETDFVLVFVHWGTEYATEIDEFQKKWSQIFLDSKADVVIGSHPHVLQPCEILKGSDGHEMLIFYSIGNFISSQNETSCIKGGMANFTISLTTEGYKITEYSLHPLTITRQEDGKFMTDQ